MSNGALNLPNLLSLSRIAAVPLFLLLVLLRPSDPMVGGVLMVSALVLAVAVAVTDWLDGAIARSRNQTSNLGKLLDPLADKVFVAAALVAYTELQIVPAWATAVIIGREFLVTGLRSIAMEQGRVIAADTLGKHKTAWQLALVMSVLLAEAIRLFSGAEELAPALRLAHAILVWLPLSVALLLTIVSGWQYVSRNRDLFG
jgi:CDP-diacylglycerol--glycerol-3-phosphate 3-phosphatidyltransferase